jgi:hypothetical protein
MPRSSAVFISYSHESLDHKNRVLSFATRLVTEGIDVRLDQWTVDPDGGWPFWMERQIAASDFVVLICTDAYRRRVERANEEQGGAGVFWEANIIRTRLYNAKGGDRRFIPVVFGPSGGAAIPEILQGSSHYQIDDPDGYIALYRRITDQPEIERPALGDLIVLPRKNLAPGNAREEATRPREHEFTLPAASSFKKLNSAGHCNEQQMKSITGSISTFIRFDNYLTEDVILYWLNYDGVRVYYTVLGSGLSHVQQTYVTHPWVVTKKDVYSGMGRCLVIFEPTSDPGIAAIK